MPEVWAEVDGVSPAPEVDLGSEVVVAFLHGIGSSCQGVRLDSVVIDQPAAAVLSLVSDPLAQRNCTADLPGSAFFVVALARDALPAEGFSLSRCPDCPGGRIAVELR